jgi:hypothetical protein
MHFMQPLHHLNVLLFKFYDWIGEFWLKLFMRTRVLDTVVKAAGIEKFL